MELLQPPQLALTRFSGAPKGGKHVASGARSPIVKTTKGKVDETKRPIAKGAIRSNKTDTDRAIRSTGQTPGTVAHRGDDKKPDRYARRGSA